MENMQRRTFDPTFKALDGQRRVPTQDELDHMLYELVRDKLAEPEPEPDPNPGTVPSDVELRRKARELGLPVPRAPEGTAERFRDDMLELLSATPEPAATKPPAASPDSELRVLKARGR
jgi:hypothetical protein